jgi:hypothetical protein
VSGTGAADFAGGTIQCRTDMKAAASIFLLSAWQALENTRSASIGTGSMRTSPYSERRSTWVRNGDPALALVRVPSGMASTLFAFGHAGAYDHEDGITYLPAGTTRILDIGDADIVQKFDEEAARAAFVEVFSTFTVVP